MQAVTKKERVEPKQVASWREIKCDRDDATHGPFTTPSASQALEALADAGSALGMGYNKLPHGSYNADTVSLGCRPG